MLLLGRRLRRLVALLAGAALAWAVVGELRKPAAERTWHGTVFGVVPYDFRLPTPARVRAAWWSPGESRLLTPRVFGVGWAVNLGRLWRLVGAQVVRTSQAKPSVPR